MSKPRVAFYDFASCEGCQLQVVNLEGDLLNLLDHIEVVSFREAMKENSDNCDIAFVEGSITRRSDEARLKKIRENAGMLVALGSCAALGGINCLKNFFDLDHVRETVYGDKAGDYETYPSRPLRAVVPVDFAIPGCPIDKKEFTGVVKSLLRGKTPRLPDYPVCVECKMAGNICAYESGQACMGPVTRAGCGATCVGEGSFCWGCRGMVDDPNTDAQRDVLDKYGLDVHDIFGKFRLYTGYSEVAK